MDKNFIEDLEKYIEQAKSGDLRTSSYRSKFKDLSVRVSFGQGTPTHVPWISFLGKGQSTSKGIYPVFLYYKKQNILVLAYGVSETNESDIKWNLENPQTIHELFAENNWGEPYRYGSSLVYSYHDLDKEFPKAEINDDLNELVKYYKEFLSSQSTLNVASKSASLLDFTKECTVANLNYSRRLCGQFICSLCAKPFLILTGLSGSGKTKIAQAFSNWISDSSDQINIVPVGADWTNREPLLGYPNALEEKGYVKPESGALDLILKAIENREKPYFLILDEMNLSHVERYFADFLSAIESGKKIKLHSGDEAWDGVPESISIPENLFIIGTVNIDETTYMFSPKVLDRANVIEFRVTVDELEDFLEEPKPADINAIKGKGASLSADLLRFANNPTNDFANKEILNAELLRFFKELKKIGAEFGYRSAYEINRFASISDDLVEDWSIQQISDFAIVQKLLPKLHGSRRKLEPVLKTLTSLSITNDKKAEDILADPDKFDFDDQTLVKYPISLEKIVRMHKRLLENGFTSFAEA